MNHTVIIYLVESSYYYQPREHCKKKLVCSFFHTLSLIKMNSGSLKTSLTVPFSIHLISYKSRGNSQLSGPSRKNPHGSALAFFGASSCPSWAAACNGVNSSNDMGFTSSRKERLIIDFLPLDFMFVPYDADADQQKVGKKLRTNQDFLEAKNLMECFFCHCSTWFPQNRHIKDCSIAHHK